MAISIQEFIKQSGGTIKDIQLLDKDNVATPINKIPETFGSGLPFSKSMTGQEFVSQPKIKQYAQAFVRTLPKDVYDFFVEQPIYFAKSVAEALPTLIGQKTPNFGGAVSESKKALDSGANPFGWEAMAKPELKTLASGLATAEIGNVAIKGIKKATPIIQKGISNVGGGFRKVSEKVVGVTITPQEQTARALAAYDKKQPTLIQRLFGAKLVGEKPITEAQSILRNSIWGTEYGAGIKSGKAQDKLFNEIINPKLKSVKNAVNIKTLISDVEKEINKIADLGRRKDLLEA